MNYPIAETFVSLQGEGLYAGTPMLFIRFAGCTVGKPYPRHQVPLGLKVFQEQCHDWDGKGFPCDTNYKMAFKHSAEDIQDLIHVQSVGHVCFTGGEPLMHNIKPLLDICVTEKKMAHIETSGTIQLNDIRPWITVSPKQGYLPSMMMRANEIKILVGSKFDVDQFSDKFDYLEEGAKVDHPVVWLSPINDEETINWANVEKCKQLVLLNPWLRMSMQLHKILKIR